MALKKFFIDKLPQMFGLVLSLLFLFIGFWMLKVVLYESKNFLKAKGQVVDVTTRSESRSRKVFLSKISFLLPNSKPVEFVEPTTELFWHNVYKVGDRVDVIYNPKNPTDARIGFWWSLYFGPIIFVGISLLVLFLMVGILVGKISSSPDE